MAKYKVKTFDGEEVVVADQIQRDENNLILTRDGVPVAVFSSWNYVVKLDD